MRGRAGPSLEATPLLQLGAAERSDGAEGGGVGVRQHKQPTDMNSLKFLVKFA